MSPPKPGKNRPWSPQQVEAHYHRTGKPVPQDVRAALDALGLASRLRPAPAVAGEGTAGSAKPPRRGVQVAPIVASLRSSLVQAHVQPGPCLSLWFEGARLLTVNELFSIFQYRKHETFAYKKAWRKLVGRAVDCLDSPPPCFDGPTRLWVYRRGRRLVDLDALPVMFKYAIDALRTHGIIPDDHPEIIVDYRPLQEKGRPRLGLRLERLPDWQPVGLEGLREKWLGLEPPPGT